MSSEIKVLDFVQTKLYKDSSTNNNDSGASLNGGLKNILYETWKNEGAFFNSNY